MKLEFDLQLDQKQQLIITPELRKAIKLLQYSGYELTSYIEQEMVENPMIEFTEEEEQDHFKDMENLETNDETNDNESRNFKDEWSDMDWQRYFDDVGDLGKMSGVGKFYKDDRETDSFENFTPTAVSLYNHLYFQLILVPSEPKIKKLAEFIIGNLDENGYLRLSIAEITELTGHKIEETTAALKMVQSLDPPGVGARDLKECLLLQIEREDKGDCEIRCLAMELIENYLMEIAENRLDKIAQQLSFSIGLVQQAVDHIKTLTPKPASPYSHTQPLSYITPDIEIRKVEEDYVIIMNDNMTPRLQLNRHYKQLLESGKQAGVSKFLNSRLNSALWLIKSIEQRRLTLYKILSQLIEFQRPFLDYGPAYIRPLTLKQVADEIEVHESTVSRATAKKYVQTPHGIFPLRFFFSSKVEKSCSDYSSATGIKQRIKELVTSEDKCKPLSDQQIANSLKEDTAEISRRTVAKYRQECGIPSSSRRKRYK